MFCRKCGKIIDDDLEFCEECERKESIFVSKETLDELAKNAMEDVTIVSMADENLN